MKFKVGDKIKYRGPAKKYLGCNGIITKKCSVIGPLYHIVKMSNGLEEHILTKHLELNQKNQQLLFEFMD